MAPEKKWNKTIVQINKYLAVGYSLRQVASELGITYKYLSLIIRKESDSFPLFVRKGLSVEKRIEILQSINPDYLPKS